MAIERNRTLGFCLGGIALLFVLTLIAYRPPEARPAGSGFSALHARDSAALITGAVPHPIGSPANTQVREALIKRLTELGWEVELQAGLACSHYASCGEPVNVIAHRPADHAEDSVLLAAHYDSVGAGPGAGDDGSGVAVLLEIAGLLAEGPTPKHPVLLLFTDGEEAGLLGADLFMREHPRARQVRAVVNVDARGTSGSSLMFETGSANQWTMDLYGKVIARPVSDSLFYTVYKLLPSDTDFSVFKANGLQGLNFAMVGDVGHYHTSIDTWQNLDLATLQHQGDNALAAIQALSRADLSNPPRREAVYLDVLSRGFLSWPQHAGLVASGIALVLFLALAVLLVQRGHVRIGEVLWGVVGIVISLLGAALLAVALVAIARLAGKVPPLDRYTWIAHPNWMNLAMLASAFFSTTLAAALISKRSGFLGFWLALAGTLASLSLLLAVVEPGTNFLVLLPACAALLAGAPLLAGASPTGNALRAGVVLAPAWMYFLVSFPVLAILYPGLGATGWPLMSLLLALGLCILLPLIAAPCARLLRSRFLYAAGFAMVLGLALTLLLRSTSPEWPLRINFEYFADLDAGQAYWIADPNTKSLRRRVSDTGHFLADAKPRFAGATSKVFFAPTALRSLPAPTLEVRQAKPYEGGFVFDLHLASPRGAPVATLVFPPSAGVRELRVMLGKESLTVPLYKLPDGHTALRLSNLEERGMDLEVRAPGPLPVLLFDQTFELPGGEFLQALRGKDAASTQDGDVTVVQRTVTLDPAAGH